MCLLSLRPCALVTGIGTRRPQGAAGTYARHGRGTDRPSLACAGTPQHAPGRRYLRLTPRFTLFAPGCLRLVVAGCLPDAQQGSGGLSKGHLPPCEYVPILLDNTWFIFPPLRNPYLSYVPRFHRAAPIFRIVHLAVGGNGSSNPLQGNGFVRDPMDPALAGWNSWYTLSKGGAIRQDGGKSSDLNEKAPGIFCPARD
jgi:hypothetical protein